MPSTAGRAYAVGLDATRDVAGRSGRGGRADVLVAVLGSFSLLPSCGVHRGRDRQRGGGLRVGTRGDPEWIGEVTGCGPGTGGCGDPGPAFRGRLRHAADRSELPGGTAPGEYRYTPGTPFAFAPHWGEVTFVLHHGSQFRPGPPYSLTSHKYAADVNEVQRLGGDGVTAPSARTDEQTEIALFWVEARRSRGIASPGRSRPRRIDLWESARLFGLLNLAMADGYIGSFDTKYHYRFWRPVPPSGSPPSTTTRRRSPIRRGRRWLRRRPSRTTTPDTLSRAEPQRRC